MRDQLVLAGEDGGAAVLDGTAVEEASGADPLENGSVTGIYEAEEFGSDFGEAIEVRAPIFSDGFDAEDWIGEERIGDFSVVGEQLDERLQVAIGFERAKCTTVAGAKSGHLSPVR